MRRFSRRLALTALGVVVFGTLVAFGAGAGATGNRGARCRASGRSSRDVRIRRHAAGPDGEVREAGSMPTYKKLMRDGVTGDNGMVRPSRRTPASAGTRWRPAPTRPSTARRTTRIFRSRRHVLNRTSFSAANTMQADTIANAAERAGKKVAQIDWVGGAAAGIKGPTVDFTNFFSNRGVLVGAANPTEQAGSAFFGVTYQVATVAPATGWTGVLPATRRRLRRRRPGRSTPRSPPRTRTATTTSTSTTASRRRVKYDRVIVSPVAKTARRRDQPEGRGLPPDEADGRQRPDRRARRPDGRPLHQADLACGRREPVQALRHVARPRDREVRRRRATASPPAAPARTGSRSTSPTTCCPGPRRTSRPRRPGSSTRTRTSSRAVTSSGPTASR